MNPKTIQNLKEHPSFKELIAFLASELDKCDRLDGLESLTFTERAYEAGIRVRLKERLTAILEPLIDSGDKPAGINPAEYAV